MLNIPLFIYSIKIILTFSGKQTPIKCQVSTILLLLIPKNVVISTMNNTKNILIITAITSLLIMGTSFIPMQSYAGRGAKTLGLLDFQSRQALNQTKRARTRSLTRTTFATEETTTARRPTRASRWWARTTRQRGSNDQSKNLALSPSGAGDGVGTGTGSGTTPTPACHRMLYYCYLCS